MGRRLGELLTQKGVKQADFARQIGERRQRVNAWITGATEISSDAVPALADKLGVTICELYGVEEGHSGASGQSVSDRFVESVAAELGEADRELLGEIGASLERYRARLRREEGL